jgi:hypothetical protein
LDKARKTVFIGYPEGSKGWRLYDPSNGKIWDSFDIRFDEHIFPMKSSNKVQYMLPEYKNEGDISASETASEEILYLRNEGEYINIGNIRNPITDEDEEDVTYVEALKDTERKEKEKNKESNPSGGSISDAFRGRLSPLDEYSEEFPGVWEPPVEESSQSPPADVRRSRRESRPNPRYQSYVRTSQQKEIDEIKEPKLNHLLTLAVDIQNIPRTYKQAMNSHDSIKWEEAMKKEMESLKS